MKNNKEITNELLEKAIVVEVENQGEKGVGRPTIFTKVALSKLKQAFLWGCTNKEACFYADVSLPAFYRYLKENPEFRDEKELLKCNLTMLARIAIMKGINDPRIAMRYLEKKKPEEFGRGRKVEVITKSDPVLQITDAELEQMFKTYMENRKIQIEGEKSRDCSDNKIKTDEPRN